MRILFICTGNTCRSPMCEAYFRQLCRQAGRGDIEVMSAGTAAGDGMPPSPASAAVMREYGIDISGISSSALDSSMIESSDIIIAMTSSHKDIVCMINPAAASKIRMLMDFSSLPGRDVADPFGGDIRTYKLCFEQMKPALDNLFLDIEKIGNEDSSK